MSKRTSHVGGEAAQFFNSQDAETQNASNQATSEKVVDLLNQSQLASNDNKLGYLKQVQELIVNKDPTLLDNFLDEILIFQQDRSADVRKFVVGFIEEACKKDNALLSKTTGCLVYMLGDENIATMKRVMLACNSMYKISLQLVCKVRTIKDDIREMWENMTELKRQICGLIESDNDGVRTHAIKFMEMLILTHSIGSSNDTGKKDDVSLSIVPANHPLVKQNDLSEEGITTLEALLAMCSSSNISSVNLMAVLSSLTNIGKSRPVFFQTVIQAFESLHANLPPNLSKSQVSSVRKNLKMQLFTLLKLPSAEPFLTQIGTLLTDLGATSSEISKSIPKISVRQVGPGGPPRLRELQPVRAQRRVGHVRHQRLLPRPVAWLQVTQPPGPVVADHAEGEGDDGVLRRRPEVGPQGQARLLLPQLAEEARRPPLDAPMLC